MKYALYTAFVSALGCVCAEPAFGQGSINFNNRVPFSVMPVVAPVFGVEPADPTLRKSGNPPADWNGTAGPTPVPVGTTVYGGAPLVGTGYTATLWAANSLDPDSALALVASTTFRATTVQSLRGFWLPPALAPVVPGIPGGITDTNRAKFQVRVWDSQNGTITTWDQVNDPANDKVARGYSEVFVVPFPLGSGLLIPPNLVGLESFNLFIVPEPRVTTFVAAISLAALLASRNKRR